VLFQLTTDTIPHLDQLLRELARTRLRSRGQRQPAREVAEFVDRPVELKANRVGSEGSARPACPRERCRPLILSEALIEAVEPHLAIAYTLVYQDELWQIWKYSGDSGATGGQVIILAR
jgi:hypothetical protein